MLFASGFGACLLLFGAIGSVGQNEYPHQGRKSSVVVSSFDNIFPPSGQVLDIVIATAGSLSLSEQVKDLDKHPDILSPEELKIGKWVCIHNLYTGTAPYSKNLSVLHRFNI